MESITPMEDRDLFSIMIVSSFSFYAEGLDALINRGLSAHLSVHPMVYFEGLFKRSGMDYNTNVLERAKSGNSITPEESVSLESAIICAYGKVLEKTALEVVNYKKNFPKLNDIPITSVGREITK
jgi:hypothetical protein